MSKIHILYSSYLRESVPIISKHLTIGKILLIGGEKEKLEFIDLEYIPLKLKSFSDPVLLSKAIIDKILTLNYSRDDLVIGVIGSNSLEVLSLYLVGYGLQCEMYTIIREQFQKLFPFQVSHLTSDEFMVLDYIYKKSSVETMGELSDNMSWEEDSKTNRLARTAYFIRKLREKRYIETIKEGRSVQINITSEGSMYYKLFEKKLGQSKEK